jgi:hypothetical protein
VFTFEPSNGGLYACFCSSPEGTILNQPRVKPRERSERCATLGCEDDLPSNPKGVALRSDHAESFVRAAPLGLVDVD